MTGETVLVTGGSGFLGAHCIVQLLAAGYRVRTSLRAASREAEVRAMLAAGGAAPGAALEVVVADLGADQGWTEALAGCRYVLHVASPFPSGVPRHEDEVIVPARDGALRVLRAARDAGVRRVVLTSSFAAIGYGTTQIERPYTERDWTDPASPQLSAYVKSKTLAERAAWDFMQREGGGMELVAINPVGIFGPVLGPDYSSSIQLVRRLLQGTPPALPQLAFGVVDVRDAVELHLRAMTAPAAAGERFLAVAGESMSMHDIAVLLRARLGATAARVPTRVLPNALVRLRALFDPAARQLVPQLGQRKRISNEKARRVLGWAPRPNEEAILATAESLLRLES